MTQRVLVLDTQVFVNLHLDFDHPQFEQLKDLTSSGNFQVSLPRMVELEVKKKLRDKVTDLHNALTKNKHLHKYFQVQPTSLEAALEEAFLSFEEFKKQLDIDILEHDNTGCDELVKLYDDMLPPFSERKKYEFPDAISLLSIDKSRYQHKDVISADNDWSRYYENNSLVRVFKSLPSFIDEKLREASEYVNDIKKKLLSHQNIENLLEVLIDEFKKIPSFAVYVNRVPQKITQDDCFNFRIKDLNITEIKTEAHKTLSGKLLNEYERCSIELILEYDVYIDQGRTTEVINEKIIEVPNLELITLSTNVLAYASIKGNAISSYSIGMIYELNWYLETQ